MENIIKKSLFGNQDLLDIIRTQKQDGYKFGVFFYITNETGFKVYHITSYETYPDQKNIDYIIEELRTDEDFRLDKEIVDNIEYIVISYEDF